MLTLPGARAVTEAVTGVQRSRPWLAHHLLALGALHDRELVEDPSGAERGRRPLPPVGHDRLVGQGVAGDRDHLVGRGRPPPTPSGWPR